MVQMNLVDWYLLKFSTYLFEKKNKVKYNEVIKNRKNPSVQIKNKLEAILQNWTIHYRIYYLPTSYYTHLKKQLTGTSPNNRSPFTSLKDVIY